jgi:hypothetical protein
MHFQRDVKARVHEFLDRGAVVIPVHPSGLGNDLEADTIRRVLEAASILVIETQQSWGASFQNDPSLLSRIKEAQEDGYDVYAVELGGTAPAGVQLIDHHGENAAKTASLLQVIELLGREPTREEILIAANDVGWIPAMLEEGASLNEALKIRAKDWLCQGISKEQIEEAEIAIEGRVRIGKTIVVNCPHSKCAPITDMLYSPTEPQDLLIISEDGEVNYFGPRPQEVLQALGVRITYQGDAITPESGWLGGPLPDKGFCGCSGVNPSQIACLLEFLAIRGFGSRG